jgi:hypothetical protein
MTSLDIVPPLLIRLQEVDIIHCCGLAVAASGRDYLRTHPPREATRQQNVLRCVFDQPASGSTGRGTVLVTLVQPECDDTLAWTCTCGEATPMTACQHVAAVLYCWVLTPHRFDGARDKDEADRHDTLPALASLPMPSVPERADLDLAAVLERWPLSELRSIARVYGIAFPTGGDRTVLARALSVELANPVLIQNAWRSVSVPAQGLWQAIVLLGGALTAQEMGRLFGRLKLGRPAQLQPVLEELRQRALLVQVEAARDGASIGWRVPREILSATDVPLPLAEYAAPERQGVAQTTASSPLAVLAGCVLLARVLPQSALHVDAGLPLSRPRPPLPTKAIAPTGVPVHPQGHYARTRLAEQLAPALGTSPMSVRFIWRLLTIIARQPALPDEALWEKVYPLLFAADRAAVTRDLFSLWLHADNYDELLDLSDYGIELRYNPAHAHWDSSNLAREARDARVFVTGMLRRAVPGRWYSFPAFVHLTHQIAPRFLRGRQETFAHPQWWPVRAKDQRPLRTDIPNEWHQVEGRFLATLFRRALSWWGAVEVLLEEKSLSAFRLTDFGRYLLQQPGSSAMALAPTAQSALSMDATGDLHVDPAAEVSLLRALDTCCEPITAMGGRLVYRLSPPRLAAALQAGQRIDALLTTFERHAATSLPASWEDALRSRAERAGRVRFYYDVPVLEAADAVAMRELEATLDLPPLLLHPLSPTAALLNGDGLPQVLQALARLGQKIAEPPIQAGGYHGSE